MRTLQLIAFAAAVTAAWLPSRCGAQLTYHTLYKFSFDDGSPNGVIASGHGTLYVTTGGPVYEMLPGAPGTHWWKKRLLYQPDQSSAAIYPSYLAVSASGRLFGVGSGGSSGLGSVFELLPTTPEAPWTAQELYSFTGASGMYPSMAVAANNKLYAVAPYAGSFAYGTVVELTPPASGAGLWSARVIYNFTGGPDGGSPWGLTAGPDGALYGTAQNGGSFGEGVVFELKPPPAGAPHGALWTESVLYSFIGGEGGANPYEPPIAASDGTLYGVTPGTVYQLSPGPGGVWTQTILYSFWNDPYGGSDGPIVLENGAIYGNLSPLTCICTCSGGSLFELEQPAPGQPWIENILQTFHYNSQPYGSLVVAGNGAVFATTYGGPDLDSGLLYTLDPTHSTPEDFYETPVPNSVCGGPRPATSGGWRR
ncbi:MAG TPA: choice-of-anchor tandem repeat GloVer-containing protein [Bryobacteraceae bacterium]|nr:choice-of-anchor tandem repeat GloVer-containing protein [Bryobacteraceae bacterium]